MFTRNEFPGLQKGNGWANLLPSRIHLFLLLAMFVQHPHSVPAPDESHLPSSAGEEIIISFKDTLIVFPNLMIWDVLARLHFRGWDTV